MNFGQLFLVINIGIIVSIINIFHVIVGYARTLPEQIYLATGHYYLDYFQYLQALSQGWHGHWIFENYFGTGIRFQTILGMWQFLVLGQIGKHLGLSQITTYWLSTILLSIVLSVLIFFFIKKLLINKPFYWHLSAYILTLFAAPFFQIINKQILVYRFWNDKAVLVDRFGGVPYHITSQIIILLVILFIADSLDKFNTLSKRSIIIRKFVVVGFLAFLLSFSPGYFLLTVSSLILSLLCLVIIRKSWLQIKFLGIILVILFPISFLIRSYIILQYYSVIAQIESAWQIHPPFIDVIYTTGPILLFAWLGFKDYFRKFSYIKLIFFNFIFTSYLFFFSPLALFIRTTNTRFLTSLNYIFFAVLTVAGIKKLKSLFIISLIVFLLFIPGNYRSISDRINDQNLNNSPISYLPKGIIDGFKFLSTLPGQQAILTTPAQFLGTLASIYSNKPVYLVRPGQQLDYQPKSDLAAKFYWKILSDPEAMLFLDKNQIGYVVLTSLENYPPEKLKSYKFLKKIYHNKDIVIYEKISPPDRP
ncbi:MAG: hypothetical protein ACD_12C00273G0005 [uncultured bacterium]|nr:MAG: hypothetical protein ACD_12C00273G0005 [uncultured bacterium]